MTDATPPTSRRAWPRVAARVILVAGLLAALATPAAVAPARADDQPTFGSATATSTFLSGIELQEPVTLPAGVTGVDALVTTEGSPRTLATPLASFSAGSTTLTYSLDTPSGAMFANTVVTLRFRVTLADGSEVLGPAARVRYEDTRFDWKTLTGSVVRVHWTEGGNDFGQRALSIADKAVADAAKLFGVTESDPIDFYVYADRSAFYDVIGPALQENIGGLAEPPIRTLFANIGATNLDDPWVGIVIPHELTHIVFGTATDNPYHEPLHWLNEGLAVYLSAGYDAGARSSVRAAVGGGTLMPLSSLAQGFPGSADRFSLAYDEAVSAIDFMVRTYGRDAVVQLVRSYARGLTDDEAFQAGIGLDVAGFEAAWLKDLGAPAPSPFGPRPAPAGAVPGGWGGAGATPGLASGSPAPGGSATSGGSSDPLLFVVGVLALGIIGFVLGAFVMTVRRNRRDGGASGTGPPGAAPSGAAPSGAAPPPADDPSGWGSPS
jgi:hypothetical protein